MLNELNYESLYHNILHSGNYGPEQKSSLTSAIRDVYEQMHEEILQNVADHRDSCMGVCQYFINRFSGSGAKHSFFFTLNQDLLVEHFYSAPAPLLKIPGITTSTWYGRKLGPVIKDAERISLPNRDTVNAEESSFWQNTSDKFVYIKLHGSYGWKGHGGSDAMVIGHTKTQVIEEEPLLRWYLSLFKDVLNEDNQTLVIIGYGFGDSHINEIIANAIHDHGLRYYVVSPKSADNFREMVMPLHSPSSIPYDLGTTLWEGLSGYYEGRVTDFYKKYSSSLRSAEGLTTRGRRFFKNLELL